MPLEDMSDILEGLLPRSGQINRKSLYPVLRLRHGVAVLVTVVELAYISSVAVNAGIDIVAANRVGGRYNT